MAKNNMVMAKNNMVGGAEAIFVFRAVGQNSLQATVERPPKSTPLMIPRSGTSAPIGLPTLVNKTIPQEK